MTPTLGGASPGTREAPGKPQGCPREAPGRHQGCTRDAPGKHQGGTRVAPRLPQGGTRAAPGRHQGGPRDAPGRHQGCTRDAPERHQDFPGGPPSPHHCEFNGRRTAAKKTILIHSRLSSHARFSYIGQTCPTHSGLPLLSHATRSILTKKLNLGIRSNLELRKKQTQG